MSHSYFVTANDHPEGEQLAVVCLSNADHEDWMTKAGLTRQMRNRETGEVETWLFHTTTHDPQPLSLCSEAFAEYVDLAQATYGEDVPEHMRALYDFIATIEAFEGENCVYYQVWLF